jgi:hypothetical protein
LSFAIFRISSWISRARLGRPGPRRRPKAAHFLLTNWRCHARTVSGWTSIPTKAGRFYPQAQRRHDRPIRRVQLWSLNLPAYDSELVPQQKQLRLRVMDLQSYINQIEEQPKPGVQKSEEHRRSKS